MGTVATGWCVCNLGAAGENSKRGETKNPTTAANRRRAEAKEELDIEPGWNNLVFLEKVEIDPQHRQTTLNIQAIETALAMFASEGVR